MLYHLLFPLRDYFVGFNVFQYITFRTAAATLTALFLSFMVGPALIRRLSALRVGQPIREIGPDHQDKAGTPTMGGLLILLSLVVSVLLWSDLTNRFVWTVLVGILHSPVMVILGTYRLGRRRVTVTGRARL